MNMILSFIQIYAETLLCRVPVVGVIRVKASRTGVEHDKKRYGAHGLPL